MKKPNAWGLYDMHGNLWEWCRDYYRAKLTGGTDPFVERDIDKTSKYVLRGGSYANSASNCRSASRCGLPPDSRNRRYGFRIALVPTN